MLSFLTFVSFLSLFICGTPLRPSRSVPCTSSSELSPWGPPPSRWAICAEAQVQSYQRGTGPCSQRHDLSLRGSGGAALCPSNTEVCLLTVVPTVPWASRSSNGLPPGLVFQAFLCCVCDYVTEIKTGLLMPRPSHFHVLPLPLLSRSCDALDRGYNRKWVVPMKSSFQKESYAHMILFRQYENKRQFGMSSQICC